jgi:hypothetical protein
LVVAQLGAAGALASNGSANAWRGTLRAAVTDAASRWIDHDLGFAIRVRK